MPGNTTIPRGNMLNEWLLGVTLSPISVAPNTSAEQSFTIPGLLVGDFISVVKPTVQAGLGIVNSRVSAANTLALAFANMTAATITPTASEVYAITVERPESTTLPTNLA